MTANEQQSLETLARLRRVEFRRELDNPRKYLRTMAKRLVYLHEKLAAIPAGVPRPYFQDDEIDAIHWLLAHYAAATEYDVRSVLLMVNGADRIDLARYDRTLAAIQSPAGG